VDIHSDTSDHTVSVIPTAFKRHLASHLEQLALFAIPIGSTADGNGSSNVAIEEDMIAPSDGSDLSVLAFDSPRPSSPVISEQTPDDISISKGSVKEVAESTNNRAEVKMPPLDQRTADLPAASLSLQPKLEASEYDEELEELEAIDPKIRSDPIVPSDEGFMAHALHLNPRLADYMVERISQQQMIRYNRLLRLKLKHIINVEDQNCPSGPRCVGLGGKPKLLPPEVGNKKIRGDSSFIRFAITAPSSSDDDGEIFTSEETVISAQFPFGVPLPPVKWLPAEFECQLCFEVKKFYTPSEWTRHIYADVQPYTCTFPNCDELESFKSRVEWTRHENERHRQLEGWICQIVDCNYTCYRRDIFVRHLIHEHEFEAPRTTRGGVTDIWDTVDRYHRDMMKQPEDEPCRFCGNICRSWNGLEVHLAKHMEQISIPIISLMERGSVNANTIVSPGMSDPTDASLEKVSSVASVRES